MSAHLLSLLVRLHARVVTGLLVDPTSGCAADADISASTDRAAARIPDPAPRDRGQATTEYALVMLGAAVVALLVVTWATAGGGAGKIGQLFDQVIDAVAGRI